MIRRGFLGGILSAPLVNALPQTEGVTLSSGSPLNISSVMSPMEKLKELQSDVEFARRRLKVAKAMKGAPKDDIYDYRPQHIYCRKATSDAVKDILVREWREEVRIREAEAHLARALWRAGAPEWLRELM